MFGLFRKKKTEPVQVASGLSAGLGTPVIGEIWYLPDGSPWATKYKVSILDVKDGWVRYRIGSVFDDERKPLSVFTSMYVRCA